SIQPPIDPTTPAAIEVAAKRFGKDWLVEHRPRRIGPAFLFEADLILAMDQAVLENIRRSYRAYPGPEEDKRVVQAEIERKLFLFSEFFGKSGDIYDPYTYKDTDVQFEEYDRTLNQIYQFMGEEFGRVVRFILEAADRNQRVRFGTADLVS